MTHPNPSSSRIVIPLTDPPPNLTILGFHWPEATAIFSNEIFAPVTYPAVRSSIGISFFSCSFCFSPFSSKSRTWRSRCPLGTTGCRGHAHFTPLVPTSNPPPPVRELPDIVYPHSGQGTSSAPHGYSRYSWLRRKS